MYARIIDRWILEEWKAAACVRRVVDAPVDDVPMEVVGVEAGLRGRSFSAFVLAVGFLSSGVYDSVAKCRTRSDGRKDTEEAGVQ